MPGNKDYSFEMIDPIKLVWNRLGYQSNIPLDGTSSASSSIPLSSSGSPTLPGNKPLADGEVVAIADLASASVNAAGIRMAYCCELEINDYPQQARWRVTGKDSISALMASTGGTVITVRGTFVPTTSSHQPSRPLGNSSSGRKLHLYIEGEHAENVVQARDEIKSILQEVTREVAMSMSGSSAGSYIRMLS